MTTYTAPAPTFIGPAKFDGGEGNKPIHRIVVHCTVSPCEVGGARNVARYFRDTVTRPSSAHYIVDPGEVVQCVWDSFIAYHAPPNEHSLGVELCDPQRGSVLRWRRRAQRRMLRRAARLVAELCLAYGVPPQRVTRRGLRRDRRGVTGHYDVSKAWGQTSHTDPGRGFPWRRFMRDVRREYRALQGAG